MKRILLAALVPTALSIAGCGSFYAQAEQPEVCITVPPQTFSLPTGGLAVAPPGGFQDTFSGQVDLRISDALPDLLVNGSPDNHILRFASLCRVGGPLRNLVHEPNQRYAYRRCTHS